MRFRNALCEKGFSFEYSATFGQAVKGNKALTELYAKSIFFDYSYRYFYGDGFGKDYQILNLDDQTQQNHLEPYLVACLLAFFQQQRLYREQESAFRPFNIDKPLWVFVGGSVTKTLVTRDASDIIGILRFLARYVADRQGSIERIERVLNQGIVTADGKNLFANRFTYLNTAGLSATQVFEETLATLFNAAGGGVAVRRKPERCHGRGGAACGRQRAVRRHQCRRRRQALQAVRRIPRADRSGARVLRLALRRDQ
jgi:hypothetical protein